MEKKIIELTLEQAKKLYKESNNDVKNLLLTTFSKEELEEDKYPNTWEKCLHKCNNLFYISSLSDVYHTTILKDYDIKIYLNCVSSKKIAKQIIALEQLLICRDVWRNGWEPNEYDFRGVICRQNDKYYTDVINYGSNILEFPDEEIAKNFLNTFKDLIIEAGNLI